MITRGKTIAAVTMVALISTVIVTTAVIAAPNLTASTSLPPTVEAGPVEPIEPGGGLVKGVIYPSGHFVRFWIAFGRNKPSEHHTGLSEEWAAGNQPVGVSEVLENLQEGTIYHYRMVGFYEHQTKKVFGAERSFTTKCYFEDPQGELGVRKCHRRTMTKPMR